MHSTPASGPANRLADETSPYLLQHAHNPVDWHPWGEQALALARDTDKPILLSIGYSACHWCHVMAHESFENEGVAAVMNELFVNIKVDREERPDLDQIYQTAHQMLTGRAGGWPLTMFLTPDGVPFFGGTYFPREPRYGMPGFTDLCRKVIDAYGARRQDIAAQNAELRQALANSAAGAATVATLHAAPLQQAGERMAQGYDPEWGGFGGAPKFPHPADLLFLLGRQEPKLRQMALFTLEKMAAGGIHDQLGGGFARYSVDERWEIPHFEKMLYDNGPLLGLYADAHALTGNDDHRRVAEGIAGWLAREMTAPSGAYYSSLDADSEGEEGKYYVWRREELDALLSPQESAVARRRWGFDGPANFEGHAWHPRVAAPLADGEGAVLESAREKLFAARERRIRPGLDDKVLTSWNALMIEGMAHAARAFARRDWLLSAQAAADFLRTTHWVDNRLLATSRHGRAQLPAYLDDHAFLLAALLELLQAEYRGTDLAFAVDLAEALLTRFEDAAGGFYFTAHDHEQLIHRPKTGFDNATPSGNGIAARALLRLGHLLGEPRYLAAAERCLRSHWAAIERSPAGHSSLLLALEEALTPPTVVVLRGPRTQVGHWQQRLGAHHARLVLALPDDLGELPAALAKPPGGTDVNAWVCRGVTCLAPIGQLPELEQVLRN